MEEFCGIYYIKNLFNEKLYIGSSSGILKRWKNHVRELTDNIHPSKYLQLAWNKYGEQAFEFIIIETCEKEKLTEREQYWIDNSNCIIPNGYNILTKARSRLGTKHSEETKAKISKSIKGIKHSIERRKNQSLGQIGRPPPNRKLSKWPHEKGGRCKCQECRSIKALISKEYRLTNGYKRPSCRR